MIVWVSVGNMWLSKPVMSICVTKPRTVETILYNVIVEYVLSSSGGFD